MMVISYSITQQNQTKSVCVMGQYITKRKILVFLEFFTHSTLDTSFLAFEVINWVCQMCRGLSYTQKDKCGHSDTQFNCEPSLTTLSPIVLYIKKAAVGRRCEIIIKFIVSFVCEKAHEWISEKKSVTLKCWTGFDVKPYRIDRAKCACGQWIFVDYTMRECTCNLHKFYLFHFV